MSSTVGRKWSGDYKFDSMRIPVHRLEDNTPTQSENRYCYATEVQ